MGDQLFILLGEFQSLSLEQILANNSNEFVASPLAHDDSKAPVFEIETFLAIAVLCATAVQEFHQQQMVHGAMNPAAILLSAYPTETPPSIRAHIQDPDQTPKSGRNKELAYLAPEQTGRMNQPVDHRADLYALGGIFYQLITRQLPFVVSNQLQLVHAHIATKPVPPVRIHPHLPLPLSDIILKLLSKDPRDRYQSANGLLADLQQCLTAWQTSAQIEPFPLGQHDISERLLLPEKGYGRQQELERLVNALDAANQGYSQLLLLSGHSGVGKSTLVGELLEPIIIRGGLLLAHTAETGQQNIPYTTVSGILRDFVYQLLVREPAEIVEWRERLVVALAGYTTRLIQQIPDLGLLLESTPNVHAETNNPQLLLNLALQNFLKIITEVGQPLLIIIDDAHKADTDSLQLLHNLAINSQSHVLVIWVYRDNETIPSYLQNVIAILSTQYQLQLPPLDLAATSCFLAETLHATTEQVHELAQLLHTKTGGNPFFLRQLIRLLHEQALIYFDHQRHVWCWHLAQILAMPIADNVVTLLQDRLQLLPEQVQKLLKVAAFMGNRFQMEQLAVILQQTPDATSQAIQSILGLGALIQIPIAMQWFPGDQLVELKTAALQQMALRFMPPSAAGHQEQHNNVLPAGETAVILTLPSDQYQFSHEQIRMAAQQLLPDISEEFIHRQIGWTLWHSLTPAQRQANLFLLVSHLNQTISLLTDWPDRIIVAHLNLQASRVALSLVAYQNALSLAQQGMAWLGNNSGWQKAEALIHDLQLTAAQAAIRLGQFQLVEQLFSTIDTHTTSVLERAVIAQERMVAFYLQGKHGEAVTTALSSLRQLGVRLPPRPGRQHIALALFRTQLTLFRKPIERLTSLPTMTNLHSLKAMEIMAAATISAVSAAPNLLILMGLEMIHQTLQYGSHPLSAMGYALYGVLLCATTGQIKQGYTFGQLALQLAPKITTKEYRVFVKYFVHAHINHWQDHIRDTLQPLRDVSATSEFEYFAVAAGLYPYFTWFISGMDVTTSEKAIADNMHLLEPFKDTPLYYRYQLGQQYYQNLLGIPTDPCQLTGEVYDQHHLLPLHLRENDHTTIFYLACHQLTLCYLFGNYEQAIQTAELALAHTQGGLGTPLVPILYFYDSLARLALYPTTSCQEAKKLLKRVVANQRKMGRWARHGPANCLHRYNLVTAEQARVLGENGRARELYDIAIQQAQSQDYVPELAVAHEVTANFYLGIGQTAYAEHHLRQAHRHYQTWGVSGKIRQIENRFPRLLPAAPPDDAGPFANLSAQLDMTSVIKATQTLSRETELSQLIDTLTTILIENAHAQDGCLLLPAGNQWRVMSRGADVKTVEQSIAAMSIVWQVARSHEPLLLNEVAVSQSADPYVRQMRPRSILCLPLLDKGELIGMFYMENRLTRHAFAPDRLPLLTTLANQAAIALKNASLVAGLQEARQTIQASEQRFRLLFENAPLGILEVDLTGDSLKVLAANRRAESLYGWPAAELALVDPAVLAPEANQPQLQQLVESVRQGKTTLLESMNQRRDGTIFPVRLLATPAQDPGGMHMIVAVEDMTAQQQRRSEVKAIEAERQRLSQEIHDGVAQNLAFLRLKLALWRDWIASDPAQMQRELEQTQTLLDDTLVEIRRSIYALRPLALDTMGLLPVLRRYVADFNEQHQVYVMLQIDIQEEQLSPDHELLLFRVIQEALNNIAQHAQASLAWVSLAMAADQAITLTIRDNGQGFDVANLNLYGRSGHLGLLQMRERIERAGGHFAVTSWLREGTTIQIKLPCT